MKRIGLAAAVAVAATAASAGPIKPPPPPMDKPTRFWNLTTGTVTSLRLSHAGSGEYGENVALGDADGVDHDERVEIVSLPTGEYDLELKYKNGRTCFARMIKVVNGKVFSVEDKDLFKCVSK